MVNMGASSAGPAAARGAEISAGLDAVHQRLRRACAEAGRAEDAVQLLAVTKNFPAADVAHLVDLGCTAFGEAREQEATPKVAELRALRPHSHPRWHVLGRLQRNKARQVARWAHRVESVDSERLLTALGRAAGKSLEEGERSTPLEVLIQVSLDDDPTRGGCARSVLDALTDIAAETDHLRLRGLMAVAPRDSDPDEAFAQLHRLWVAVRVRFPDADQLSAGMSLDLEAAVRHGSTCVRVGTALLGSRPIAST